ncbi:MAG: EAL domain-containing protein [Clostridium tyrobutyricum]|jgi:diguanylate cyclase (GGDEF)-like protein/PAS domain S-box-containing protein|uniref:bifunctional diguanylate cyclase/phosphodiesterase n=1 Tax=Clostridium tyrobutyricum TaxID=1519 RepID=UPI0018A9E6FD|nr:GGDEF domain-containing phosphodiesterase [Clostridium tyrobutyricum]MCH4200749.1 EAL domain-containing protein [Clostridium tyrobutyricum]MCH4237367.1 EAL domain-containing protein [Clostridium tyrobutyricum]MCH4257746.1 EAL domain-containing protein [Clostridium tyrobutyricum]MCI1237984.1 EAL domain-containing protein [Clostridium tyrobutyricum]MCI1651697.1 EAL domain-containing protein [Clostridium tyrobutyricum]
MQTNYTYNEQTYIRALRGANIVLWEWCTENSKIFFSNNLVDITGYDSYSFINLLDFIEKIVVSDDRTSAKNDLTFFMNGNTTTYRSDFRILTKDGKIKYFLITGKTTKTSKEGKKFLSGSLMDITEKKLLEEQIKYLAYYDSLTGIPNRFLFTNNLRIMLQNSKKGALIFLDIDGLKLVNDTFGHDYGDLLLIIFSQLMISAIKDSGKIYRMAGDEFMIIVDKFNSYKEVTNLCDNILNYLKKPFEVKYEQIYITISMGISIFPKDSNDINELYKYSDLALYKSKISGKNNFTFFQKNIFDLYNRRLTIEQELKSAIKNNEFHMLYQPQINSKNNEIIGFESLLRWESQKLGCISPAEFIPIAEKTGLIVEIGDWTLNCVCKVIHAMNIKGIELKKMSINVSPIQLRKPDFIYKFTNTYKKYAVSPSILEVEITEGTLINLSTSKLETIDILLKNGIRVSIDDFGTGYSSLNYLTNLPINTIKIDKSFIDNIYSKKNKAVVSCIINLSKLLNYEVIAEGVETKKQLDLLSEIGCTIIQGYYFSKPLPICEVEKLLIKGNTLGGA